MRIRALLGTMVAMVALALAPSALAAAAGTILTAAGTGVRGAPVDGSQATEAPLNQPRSIFVTSDGGIVWAQPFANTVIKMGPDGIVTRLAGTGTAGFSGDGGPATNANLSGVHAAVPTADGGYVIADTGNHRIRRIAPDGTITTIAGTGVAGYTGDGGPATSARINAPRGVAVLADGSILIPDTGNNRIRRVTPAGTISTVAGTGSRGFTGDGGPATAARLDWPFGVAGTAAGGFLIVDRGNQRIREVRADGTIVTVAGNGAAGFAGDGGPATAASIYEPHNVVGLADGGFLIADTFNHRIRAVDAGGTISTIAGTGVNGFAGDGGLSTLAQLNFPKAVAVTPAGNVLVADEQNDRIRFVGVPVAPANSSPPVLTGPAAEGATLSGSAGGWSGTALSFSRQWRRCDGAGAACVDVPGATSPSYQLTEEDVGATLRLAVTASNSAGSAQAESAASAVVTAAPEQPFFVASAAAASSGTGFTIPVPAGLAAGDLLLAWVATDSPHAIATAPPGWTQLGTTQNDGADSSISVFSRLLAPGDPSSVNGSFTAGEAGQVGVLAYRGVDQTAPIEIYAQRGTGNTTATITPAGNGRTIVALFGGDPGSNPRTGTPDADPAATERLETQNATYGFTYAQDHAQQLTGPIALDVTWNGGETAASFVLALTSSSTPIAPANNSPPTISGQAEEGTTLTGNAGTWTGSQPISYAYRWRRCDAAGAGCTDIAGATASTYVVAAADVGATLRLAVTASNTAGSAQASSAQTAVVTALVAPANTAPPAISGQAQAGSTLTGSPGSWSGSQPISFAYQWRRCDGGGEGCVEVAGATTNSYSVTEVDVGSTLRLAVTASNGAGSAEAVSAASAVVTAAPDQPFFVAAGSAGSSGTGFTITTPTGAAAGDLLLAWVATDSPHAIATAPPGWTQLGTTQANGTDSSVSVFSRLLAPGDPTSVSGSFTAGESGSVGVLAYRGVDQTAAIETFAQSGSGNTTAAITPAGNARTIVALFGGDPGSNPRTGTPDTDPAASERLEAQNGTYGFTYAQDHLQQTSAPIALDVAWNGSESAASFILALVGP